MPLNLFQKILSLYLLLLIVFWVILYRSGLQTDFWNYFYSFSFSLIPLIGGAIGIFTSRGWGFLESAIGRAIFYISGGLFSWGVGSMIWSYYNIFLNIPAPYPALADIGFFLALPLWIIGVINLSKATGAKFSLRKNTGKLFLVIVPILIIAASYYLLVQVARGGSLSDLSGGNIKIFLDLAYPAGDVIILSLALLIFGLSFRYFGGLFKIPIILILLGFALMYFADFIFSYTTTIETFYNGSFGDLVFTLALFLITYGVLGFNTKIKDN